MKIGIDGNSLTRNLTGVGLYTYDMIRFVLEKDDDNVYYLYVNKKMAVEFKEDKRLIVRNSNTNNIVFWYMIGMPFQVKKDKLDVFWEPGNRLPIMPPKNTKLITTIHDMASYLFPKYCSKETAVIEKLFLKKTCKRATSIISISEATKKDILKTFVIPENKISVIYDGDTPYKGERKYNQNYLAEMKKMLFIDQPYLLFVGSISPRKNIITILKAYEVFRNKSNKYREKLVLAGKMAWKTDEIKKMIQNSNYCKDIIVTGYVSDIDLEYLYKYAECLLFPSRYEGFGFPIIEAMSLGTRVITSNISSMPEVGGDAALYLKDLDNYEELAELIVDMVDMPEDQKIKMIKKSINRSKMFNRQDSADALYQMLIKK